MIPVNEGNDECRKCGKFCTSIGCSDIYQNKSPSCRRSIVMKSIEYDAILTKIEELERKLLWNQIKNLFRNAQRKL